MSFFTKTLIIVITAIVLLMMTAAVVCGVTIAIFDRITLSAIYYMFPIFGFGIGIFLLIFAKKIAAKSELFRHEGYVGSADYSLARRRFSGHLLETDDDIYYEAETYEKLKDAFIEKAKELNNNDKEDDEQENEDSHNA